MCVDDGVKDDDQVHSLIGIDIVPHKLTMTTFTTATPIPTRLHVHFPLHTNISINAQISSVTYFLIL